MLYQWVDTWYTVSRVHSWSSITMVRAFDRVLRRLRKQKDLIKTSKKMFNIDICDGTQKDYFFLKPSYAPFPVNY